MVGVKVAATSPGMNVELAEEGPGLQRPPGDLEGKESIRNRRR